ncbi:MAG: hypothetical protein KAX15_00155, partial [Candidatus Omnitrophica bacterium]|nr:hypothetical protein [Candidatus Omnitrophota bacterium]
VYNHVFSLLIYKTLFLGIKPLDPAQLPYEVRSIWVAQCLSPGFNYLVYNFTLLFIPALVGVGLVFKQIKRKKNIKDIYFVYLSVCFLILFAYFFRMVTSFIFVFCVYTGLSTAYFYNKSKNSRGSLLRYGICLIIIIIMELVSTVSLNKYGPMKMILEKRMPVNKVSLPIYGLGDSHQELLAWIKGNTMEDEVFLTHFSTSTRILVYAGRTIVLQPKFETQCIRDKVENFLSVLFDQEQKLY